MSSKRGHESKKSSMTLFKALNAGHSFSARGSFRHLMERENKSKHNIMSSYSINNIMINHRRTITLFRLQLVIDSLVRKLYFYLRKKTDPYLGQWTARGLLRRNSFIEMVFE